jgi:hypothetical protein
MVRDRFHRGQGPDLDPAAFLVLDPAHSRAPFQVHKALYTADLPLHLPQEVCAPGIGFRPRFFQEGNRGLQVRSS